MVSRPFLEIGRAQAWGRGWCSDGARGSDLRFFRVRNATVTDVAGFPRYYETVPSHGDRFVFPGMHRPAFALQAFRPGGALAAAGR